MTKRIENEVEISNKTQSVIVEQIRTEKEMLKMENLKKTYDTWRQELRDRLSFFDELLKDVTDRSIKQELINKQKNQAILEISNQQLMPVIRNAPDSKSKLNNVSNRADLPSTSVSDG